MRGNGEVKAIIQRLLELKAQRDTLATEESLLWAAFFRVGDEEVGEDAAYRYLDHDTGLVLARQVVVSSSLDERVLEANLSRQQWLSVTVAARRLDPVLLEAALRRGRVSEEAVEAATTHRLTVRRYGPRRASEEDLEEIALEEGLAVKEEAR